MHITEHNVCKVKCKIITTLHDPVILLQNVWFTRSSTTNAWTTTKVQLNLTQHKNIGEKKEITCEIKWFGRFFLLFFFINIFSAAMNHFNLQNFISLVKICDSMKLCVKLCIVWTETFLLRSQYNGFFPLCC